MAYRRRYAAEPGSITTTLLAPNAVVSEKLGEGAVAAREILDKSIGSDDLADDCIELRHLSPEIPAINILDASITEDKLAPDSVATSKVKDGAIISGKIGTGAVTVTKIADDGVQTLKIKDGAVTAPKLATDSVETAKIKNANVTAEKLATDSVETAKIKDTNVTPEKLAPLTEPILDWKTQGTTIRLIAAQQTAFGDVGYINATGKVVLAKADVIANANAIVMCAQASIGADELGTWLLFGIARNDEWSWTPGNLIYLSTVGTSGNTLTQTAPSGANNVIQILGVAKNSYLILFKPSLVQVEHV